VEDGVGTKSVLEYISIEDFFDAHFLKAYYTLGMRVIVSSSSTPWDVRKRL